jgi:hypothetical protein
MPRPKTGRRVRPQYRALVSPRNFEQFLNGVIPPDRRAGLAERFDYDWHAHKLFFEPYFRALVTHRFTAGSLNDLQYGMAHDLLYAAHGAKLEISVAALSKANANRPVEPFLLLLGDIFKAIGKIPKSGKVLRQVDTGTLKGIAHLLEQTRIFDATSLSLPVKIAHWAQVKNKNEAGFKLQLRLAAGYGGPDRVILTPKAGNDNPYFLNLLDLQQDAGHIYLFDAGYFKIKVYDGIVASGNHFVTTRHEKITYQVIRERSVPEGVTANGYTIHTDREVYLGTGERRSGRVYRLLEVTDSQGHRTTLLTDLLALTAEQICQLYTYRWIIEIVFRWLKSLLEVDQFISYSPNGVIMQVLVALIVYGLMVLYHEGGPLSLARILRRVRADLHQAIYEYGFEQGRRQALREVEATGPP